MLVAKETGQDTTICTEDLANLPTVVNERALLAHGRKWDVPTLRCAAHGCVVQFLVAKH